MSGDENWWEANLSRELEESLAMGGLTPHDLDPSTGEFLRKVSQVESILAAATMAYFAPARTERAAELEALFSYHLEFEVLIDMVPRFMTFLTEAQQEWVERQCTSKLTKELNDLRGFRNALAHGQLWWDFAGTTSSSSPPLKVHSYTRSMRLKSVEVSRELMEEWIGRAYNACTVVGQIHYWMTEAGGFSNDP